jgi:hypothetical protein
MWDQQANRVDRNRAYDGSVSGRRRSYAGLPDAERVAINGEILREQVRILVQDGLPTCPEGERLLRERNARWNRLRK